MSRIEWPTKFDMFEAIGYLACPGVVARIEATVPADRIDKFILNYEGKYSEEYPYVVKAGSKYGEQLRLYLNDNDGCPSFLRNQLDATYGVRLNDTAFIKSLVLTFNFRITNSPQDSQAILNTANQILSTEEYKAFMKGYNKHNEFIESFAEFLDLGNIPEPLFAEVPIVKSGIKKKASKESDKNSSSYTKEQLQKIGWLGEKYIYMLLLHNKKLLQKLYINTNEYNVQWFNKGFENDDNWEDKSIGEGCDLVVETENQRVLIEVKTSKKDGRIFTMTHNEMLQMQIEKESYYIFKLNWAERLLLNKSPELIVYENPYETIFKPSHIKEATFYVRS